AGDEKRNSCDSFRLQLPENIQHGVDRPCKHDCCNRCATGTTSRDVEIGAEPFTHQGISSTFPVVFLPASTRWASAASVSETWNSVRNLSAPLPIHPNRSLVRCCSSARLAM